MTTRPPLQFRHTTHTVDCCNCVTFAIQPADGGPGLEVDNKVEALRGLPEIAALSWSRLSHIHFQATAVGCTFHYRDFACPYFPVRTEKAKQEKGELLVDGRDGLIRRQKCFGEAPYGSKGRAVASRLPLAPTLS